MAEILEQDKALELKKAIETLLFITDAPISIAKICQAVGVKDKDPVEETVAALQREYEDRETAMQILEVADGFQMATRSKFAGYVRNLYKDKMTMRLSTAALETLAIIAYKQPITRAEIEAIRGVEVIASLETLLEKALVKVVGRKDSVGRPLLYGTSAEFLRHFGLRNVDDLPPFEDFAIPEVDETETKGREPGADTLPDEISPELEDKLEEVAAAEATASDEPSSEPLDGTADETKEEAADETIEETAEEPTEEDSETAPEEDATESASEEAPAEEESPEEEPSKDD